MKTSSVNIDILFEFTGLWGISSTCGLKHISKEGKEIIVVSELYKDNPGTSITQVTTSLAMQICDKFNIDPKNLIYIEHSPNMNSRLSFYDEYYYLVEFEIKEGNFTNPGYKRLTEDELNLFLYCQTEKNHPSE
jgi:hypothetical protein